MTYLNFLLGPTNVGKTTLIDQAVKELNAHGVFVGRVLRAKYGEDYFKGQAAPEHTKKESLEIMDQGITEGLNCYKPLILVDGQPRSDDQLEYIIEKYLKRSYTDMTVSFLLLYCSDEVRRKRMESRDLTPEKKRLTEQRFYGDLPQVHKLIHDLIILGYGYTIHPIDSENSFEELKKWYTEKELTSKFIDELIKEHSKK